MNEQLAHDISMNYPDDIWCLSMLERYMRTRNCTEFCTLDENRYFIRGVLSLPFIYTDGDFTWGVWCEVSKADHDAFFKAYANDTLDQLPDFSAKLANEIPGYENSKDCEITVEVLADERPLFVVKGHELLAQEQHDGLSYTRHQELNDILFGDDEDFDEE